MMLDDIFTMMIKVLVRHSCQVVSMVREGETKAVDLTLPLSRLDIYQGRVCFFWPRPKVAHARNNN